MRSKENLNILTRKHDHDRVSKWFKNSKKIQIKFEIYDISEGYSKNLNEFWIFFHVRSLFLETSLMMFHKITKDMVGFVGDATFK
jgi:hypothetical protein